MTFDTGQLKTQIPYYLTAEPDQKELLSNLQALNRGAEKGYYISATKDIGPDAVLQGDGWQGFQLYSFKTGKKREVRGIVLSNSCDISTDNKRDIPQKLIFAPIIKLSAAIARYKKRNPSEDAIENRIKDIKRQSVSNIFWLPAGAQLDEDYVAFLDDLHSIPTEYLLSENKLFTLSMAGFYLFVFKLSVHFCRLQENVDRSPS